MRSLSLALATLLLAWLPQGRAAALEPFLATYDAWYEGRHAGDATMRVAHLDGTRWEVELDIRGRHGLLGLARLNMGQSTVFDVADDGGRFRPLTQRTVRKALFFGREIDGVYDWDAGTAQWSGDVSKRRRNPVPLREGDLSALLINLAIIRDAEPGVTLNYRFVDNGRARDHVYRVAEEPEIVEVGDLSYSALRVSRVDDDDDETLVWVASGVPTPIRILKRDAEGDDVDLRLIEYQGTE
ncbi:DUF3108 domain-containing protein [Luteimonas sp. RD2P54]|uniref:DUF3108 domain-containing protein n=1 Tax=Luteimonas endophytica TaxID=3042023 RepID=A0ABT6JCS5_9GAMM|nr:DUF3108 domain-containing protein [Luteimonas endophytica]MDH5824008.1 DUF3108 domain-containing protein [Luteimonas endophytica]